jgi:hypothetical protein
MLRLILICLLIILFVDSVIFDFQATELRNGPPICNRLSSLHLAEYRTDVSISV